MPEIAPAQTVELLRELHNQLDVHFRQLSTSRIALDQSAPVFALEHDLSKGSLEYLYIAVRKAVADGLQDSCSTWWLPFVVYATELGYDYVGDEYWQSFEDQTPGWKVDHRRWIRTRFEVFAKRYGGFVPTGTFATHFRNIAWPTTHCVMPKYLQRQMAQLLFEFRGALTTQLLDDPLELGQRLYARSGSYSERFHKFCTNTALVGHVATALLSGEDDSTPYLTPSTLKRLVDGLSEEQEARTWLQSARKSAVEARGFRPTRPAGAPRSRNRELPRLTDPVFVLRFDRVWIPFVQLPNLTHVGSTNPELQDVLRRRRCFVDGGADHLPPSALLYPGQEMRLVEWPSAEGPFLYAPDADDSANRVLGECCEMTTGPWLFRKVEEGLGMEIKGKVVRPGQQYVLITSEPDHFEQVSWVAVAPFDVQGAHAYCMDVPQQLGDSDAAAIGAAGLSVVSRVSVRPVGVVPSSWDGEGDVEWVAGETGLLAISSDMAAERCNITVDGALYSLNWDEGDTQLRFSVEGLEVGTHDATVTILGEGGSHIASRSLLISIRDPWVRNEEGTAGEGIRLLASPARPLMTELWDGRATVFVDGPVGATASLTVSLKSDRQIVSATATHEICLPLEAEGWNSLAQKLRRALSEAYDEAESCVVSVSRDGIGFASLTCDRGFRPLHWRLSKRKKNSPQFVRLVDRTDGHETTADFYGIEAPTAPKPFDPGAPFEVPRTGGLVVADVDNYVLATILPADPNDQLRGNAPRPTVVEPGRHPTAIRELIKIDQRWGSAEMPGDPFAAYDLQRVHAAISRAIAVSVCGRYWAQIEHRMQKAEDPADLLDAMEDSVGESHAHRQLATYVGRSLYKWLERDDLESGFGAIVNPYVRESGMDPGVAPSFLLALASEPGLVADWSPPALQELLEQTIRVPVLLRLARFAVLGTEALSAEGLLN